MNRNQEHELTIVSNMLPQIDDQLKLITEKHEKVSKIKTPTSEISQLNGLDYVEISYMKHIAHQEYPGWSWEIISHKVLGSEAYVVHGRLTYYVSGIKQTGDMVDAHKIMKFKDRDQFVDVGHNIKAANTDCMKKAFNMYMNIADDVYRNQVINLDEEEKMLVNAKMIKAGFDTKEIDRISLNINKGKVNKLNLEELYQWIDTANKPKKESKGK